MFGGMLDSSYTESRCPLWVFDIGKVSLWENMCCAANVVNKWQADTQNLSLHVQHFQTTVKGFVPRAVENVFSRPGKVIETDTNTKMLMFLIFN